MHQGLGRDLFSGGSNVAAKLDQLGGEWLQQLVFVTLGDIQFRGGLVDEFGFWDLCGNFCFTFVINFEMKGFVSF